MLREIIEEIIWEKPHLNKKELFEAVMARVKSEGFFSKNELSLIEDELKERLENY